MQLPSTLATGSYDGVIIVWNIDSGAIKLKLQVTDHTAMKKLRIVT
jgi:WD40 repeat protein